MDPNLVSLIVGLSGIGATLLASFFGIYFTARAKNSTLREMLYSKQIEIITKVLYHLNRFRIYVDILSDSKNHDWLERARADGANSIRTLSKLTSEASAILPSELWVDFKKVESCATSLLISYDDGKGISEEQVTEFAALDAKAALVARSVLGVDELTEETLSMSGTKKNYRKLINMEIAELRPIVTSATSSKKDN